MPSVDAGIRSQQRVSGGTRGFSEGAEGFRREQRVFGGSRGFSEGAGGFRREQGVFGGSRGFQPPEYDPSTRPALAAGLL
jgi:hypothetical protein